MIIGAFYVKKDIVLNAISVRHLML